MRKYIHTFLVLALFFCGTEVQAQDDMQLRQICSQAESDMQIGRTEEARDTLLHHLNAFKGTLKRDALRIIALSFLSDYDEQKATLMMTSGYTDWSDING